MSQRIVLIGAGSASFGLGTLGDILDSDILRGSTVVLHDINAESLARVEGLAREEIRRRGLPFDLVATTSRREALQGATFCIISIEVGRRFELWEQDWRIPQQYGIRQVYGENGGPGGLFHALRIIPPILDICGDIMEVCPEAHVFSFSNPMSRICLAVKRKFPALRFTGLCHEAAALPQHLPAMLDTNWANLEIKAGGLNHFTVLLEARYRDSGRDAYPDIRAKARGYFEHMPTFTRIMKMALSPEQDDDPAPPQRWEERWLVLSILERFGCLPVTTDSHFGEYIHWAHEVVDHESIVEFYMWYKRWCLECRAEAGIGGTGERVIPMIEAIVSDGHDEELAVNVMNDGLIDNLPRDLVVEVPGVIDGRGVHGVPLGPLPKGIAGLLANQVAVHDLCAEAALTGSRQAALQALLVDPVVDSVRAAEQILDTMLRLQKEYLGYIK
ncbi:MAG TPA: alpha-glucosidase [Anaerolineae bacterium]|nr:alpha-glucosidase [Anaerolineae bacterium]HOQ98986.1 alpha-glucosidase [Anaerolineae bacterium]HPL28903.1 alpha-glucosidase [Anaerolineae bacterium]